MRHLPTLSTFTLTIALLCGAAQAASETKLEGAPHWTHSGPGADFVTASATTRASWIPIPQSNPFVLNLPAPPAGAQKVRAFVVWHFHLNGPAPASDQIFINGNFITGTYVGGGTPDLGWSKARTAVYMSEGPGTGLVLGGANVVLGATDRALGSDPNALGAGLSVLVVYEVPGATMRNVSVWRGYSSTESSTSGNAEVDLDLTTPYTGNMAHVFLSVLDGEPGHGDEFHINGIDVSGDLPGTGTSSDNWRGLAGPSPDRNLYDGLDAQINSYMSLGDVELRMRSLPVAGVAYEQVGHSLAALSLREGCGGGASYCSPQFNSLGCAAVMHATGSASAGASTAPFQIAATNLRNKSNGLLIYGFAEGNAPLGNGTLCISGTVRRTTLQSTGGSPTGSDCTGVLSMNWNAWAATAGDPLIQPGGTIYVQYWSRDVDDPFGSNLSGGLAFNLCP